MEESKPIIVFEFQMQNQGFKTMRIVQPLRQVLANIGGITRVVLPTMIFIIKYFTFYLHAA